MTRPIDADALLRFLDRLQAARGPHTFSGDGPAERAWALRQVRAYVETLAEPQPTFNDLERGVAP